MRATLNGVVLAEAPDDRLIHIESNWYFPPDTVNAELLENSNTPYHCHWKGECQFFNVRAGDELFTDRAWSYPAPIPASIHRVGRDYTAYVAFWKEVDVSGPMRRLTDGALE